MLSYAQSPIFSDGQLVYPQTMQAVVLHADYRLHRRFQCSNLDAAGLVRCGIDLDALRRGEIVVRDICLALPSGQLVDTAAGDAIPARRIDTLTPGGPPVRVWVGLPRERDGAANCADDGAAGTRFVREERALADWGSGQRRVKIGLARPNVQVRLDAEAAQEFDGVAIAEVLQDADGRIYCADDFIPPVMNCAAAPALTRRLDALLAQAHTRCEELLHHWSLSRGGPAALTALDVIVKTAHAALSGIVPSLRAMRRAADRLPPFALYMQLLSFAGTMAALTGDETPLDLLPGYHPDDLRRTFVPLYERVHALLQRSVYDNYICIPFTAVRGNPRAFSLQFEDPRVALASEFLLRMHLSDDHGRVVLNQDRQIVQLIRQAKLGAPDQQVDMDRLALGGVRLDNASSIPGLPVHSGCGYFRLDRADKRFLAVLAQRRGLLRFPDGIDLPETTRPHFALIAVINHG
jgi:type VI secretion system ImpJ/VasE family protein